VGDLPRELVRRRSSSAYERLRKLSLSHADDPAASPALRPGVELSLLPMVLTEWLQPILALC